MSPGVLHRVALVRPDVSENILPPSSGGYYSTVVSVTVESLFISLPTEGYYIIPKNAVFWDVFTTVNSDECLLGYCTVWLLLHPTFRRTYHLHLQDVMPQKTFVIVTAPENVSEDSVLRTYIAALNGEINEE
jgi:hypothetical protein